MSQRKLADSQVLPLLECGPFLGIDATTSPLLVGKYHAADSINFMPNQTFLGLTTCLGRQNAFAANFASQLYGLAKFITSANSYYVAAVNSGGVGALQYAPLGGAPTALTLPSNPASFTTQSARFVPMQNWLFFTDGVSKTFKIDQSFNVTNWGIIPPGVVGGLGAVSGGGMSGTYFYFVTFFSAFQESSKGTLSGPITCAGPQTAVTTYSFSGSTAVGDTVTAVLSKPGPVSQTVTVTFEAGKSATEVSAIVASAISNASGLGAGVFGTTAVAGGNQLTFVNVGSIGLCNTGTFTISTTSTLAWSAGNNTAFAINGGSVQGSVSLTAIPVSSDPQVTGRNIYRFGGSQQDILLVGTLTDNTTTTFTDTLADTAITGQALVQYRDPPRAFYDVEDFQGCLWGFGYSGTAVGAPTSIQGSSDLWYSNYQEPWGFNSVNQVIPVGRNNNGDVAVRIKKYMNTLYCLKSRSFWSLVGSTPQDYIPMQLYSVGCIAPLSVSTAFDRLFWLSEQGVQMFDTVSLTNISDNRTSGAKSSIKGVLETFSVADLRAAVGAPYDQGYLLSFPTQGITYYYNIPDGQWFKLSFAADCVVADPENLNEVTASRIGLGTVVSWFASQTDLGGNIAASYISRITDSGVPEATKRYRYLNLVAPLQAGVSATLTLTVNPGSGQSTNTQTVSLASGPEKHVLSIPPTAGVGQAAQLTTAVSVSTQTNIYRAGIYGWVERHFVPAG